MNKIENIVIIHQCLNGRIKLSTSSIDKNRFKDMLALFRTIDKRYWDSVTKQWSFPASACEMVKEKLEQLGMQVTIIDYKPMVSIIENDTGCLLESHYNPTIYNIIQNLPSAQWI
jgi:hypothetical protein